MFYKFWTANLRDNKNASGARDIKDGTWRVTLAKADSFVLRLSSIYINIVNYS